MTIWLKQTKFLVLTGVITTLLLSILVFKPREQKVIPTYQKIKAETFSSSTISNISKANFNFLAKDSKINNNNNNKQEIKKNTDNSSDNLTDLLAKKLASKIIKKNKDGLIKKNGRPSLSAPQIENLINDWLAKNKSEKFMFNPKIDQKRLRISYDDSWQSRNEYLKKIIEINNKNFGNFKKTKYDILLEVFEDNNFESVKKVLNIYKNLISDYYQLKTPPYWLDLHKKMILHFEKDIWFWRSILNFHQDPLSTYIAFNSISLLENETQSIQNLLDKKIKEGNLKY